MATGTDGGLLDGPKPQSVYKHGRTTASALEGDSGGERAGALFAAREGAAELHRVEV